MSQEEIFNILEELNGEATTNQIRRKTKEKYPERTLHTYVMDRLRKLERWGYIMRIEIEHDVLWKIVKKYG